MVGSWTDWDLTELGVEQADRIGRGLQEEFRGKTPVLYSSDLKRAKQTADEIAKYLGTEPILRRELRERNLGRCCGQSVQWLRENLECPEKTVDDRLFSDGESRRDAWNRLQPLFEEVMGSDAEEIIIVSHGDLLSIWNAMFTGLPAESLASVTIHGPAGGVSRMDVGDDGRRRVKQINDLSYVTRNPEWVLKLQDNEWPLAEETRDRMIARAIVVDDEGMLTFVRADRDDDFGKATLIETAGGGIEAGENPESAILRELKEELGADVEVICKIGVVSDYYNLIHRHNINNYYLCRVTSMGVKHLTQQEIEEFHLSTLRLTYDEALAEYRRLCCTGLGRLVANREVPVLMRAKDLWESVGGAFKTGETQQ